MIAQFLDEYAEKRAYERSTDIIRYWSKRTLIQQNIRGNQDGIFDDKTKNFITGPGVFENLPDNAVEAEWFPKNQILSLPVEEYKKGICRHTTACGIWFAAVEYKLAAYYELFVFNDNPYGFHEP